MNTILCKLPFFIGLFFISLFMLSCQKDDPGLGICDDLTTALTKEQQVFLDISFGSEFGKPSERIRKWTNDIRIFVPEPIPELEAELNNIISEINQLSETIQLSIVQTPDSSNLLVFFGRAIVYALQYEPSAIDLIDSNNGLFSVNWNPKTFEIFKGSVCVDIQKEQNLDCQKHLLREELTQALGMMNDSGVYEESIFYSAYTCSPSYSELDRQFIQNFLSGRIEKGMCPKEVVERLVF
jgi:hypothetical protein